MMYKYQQNLFLIFGKKISGEWVYVSAHYCYNSWLWQTPWRLAPRLSPPCTSCPSPTTSGRRCPTQRMRKEVAHCSCSAATWTWGTQQPPWSGSSWPWTDPGCTRPPVSKETCSATFGMQGLSPHLFPPPPWVSWRLQQPQTSPTSGSDPHPWDIAM